MTAYVTKEQLVKAYAAEMTNCDPDVALICAKSAAKYTPHIYNGGWFIRGFGYSTERIGKYVNSDKVMMDLAAMANTKPDHMGR